MNEIVLNWVVALAAIILILFALYQVIRMAVREGMKAALQELGREVAKKVWKDEEDRQG